MNVPAMRVGVRRMSTTDLERVLEIAERVEHAPRWPVSAYVAAVGPEGGPRRIALVLEGIWGDACADIPHEGRIAGAEQAAENSGTADKFPEKHTSGAKAPVGFVDLMPGINPWPTARESLSEAGKAEASIARSSAQLKPCPDTIPSRSDRGAGFSANSEDMPPQDSGRVLGFAVANMVPPEAELETIAIVPAHQRLGSGALLLRALVEELRKEQVTELILEVRASNRAALGFYRGQGFEEIGRRVRYYADPEEDAVLMRLKLA
jgi:ribosomal-protein-alanine acetyltransferase